VITSVNEDAYYRVVYEDSDSEEFTPTEVRQLLDSVTTEGDGVARDPATRPTPPPLPPAGQQRADQVTRFL